MSLSREHGVTSPAPTASYASTRPRPPTPRPAGAGLPGDVVTIALATVALVLAGLLLARAGAASPVALGAAALLWIGLCALVFRGREHHPFARFGAANAVTTARAAITVLLAALAVEADFPDGPLAGEAAAAWAWFATCAALLALALDGIDGPLARAGGLDSAFGARYDMETDALLALVLAMLVWRSGELGAWVLALGTLRYAYLIAARALPALRRPLFPSVRRKTVCVIQIAALCAIVCPLVAPPLSTAIGLGATIALAVSFAVDMRWQLSGGTLP